MAAPRWLRSCLVAVSLPSLVGACSRDAAPGKDGRSIKDGDPGEGRVEAGVERSEATSEAAGLVRGDGTIFAETKLMGTHVSINLWVGVEGDALLASEAITDAMTEIARIEDIASEWRETSDLSRVNQAEGAAVEVPEELMEILARGAAVSADTEGLFDVSFHGVGQLWHFEPGSKPPSAEAIAEHLPSVDWRSIELDPRARTVRLAKPNMQIGLGAIAKGYAVDRAASLLHDRGFANHIVEAGGDTQVSGKKGDQPWRVGVQDPEQTVGRVGHIVASDEAVVTSGNYARYFEWEGVHYTHILDPRTGWPIPAERSAKSVTLVAGNATDADAYCTAVSVMTPAQGLAFIEAHPQLEAVIIGPDNELHVSSGLSERFVKE